MKQSRTKVPRASIGVTIADDPDYIALVQSSAGREAIALYIAMIVQAKVQRNEGRFAEPETVIAAMVRWPADAFLAALQTLIKAPGRWVVRDGGAIIIRSFEKWNDTRGGQRLGAGRKRKAESIGNQSGINRESKGVASVPVSVPVSPVGDTGASEALAAASRSAKRVRSQPTTKIHWSEDRGWQGISDADGEAWKRAYPAVVDLDGAMARASEWLRANPSRAKKSNWRRFLTSWLAREQECGGDLRYTGGGSGRGDHHRNGKPSGGATADSWEHLRKGAPA